MGKFLKYAKHIKRKWEKSFVKKWFYRCKNAFGVKIDSIRILAYDGVVEVEIYFVHDSGQGLPFSRIIFRSSWSPRNSLTAFWKKMVFRKSPRVKEFRGIQGNLKVIWERNFWTLYLTKTVFTAKPTAFLAILWIIINTNIRLRNVFWIYLIPFWIFNAYRSKRMH